MGILSSIFGNKNKVNCKDLIEKGAIVIDVRGQSEFSTGHIEKAINIPLDQLSANFEKIKQFKQPIVVCCASGMRSSTAKNILKNKGLIEVYNGGSWKSLL